MPYAPSNEWSYNEALATTLKSVGETLKGRGSVSAEKAQRNRGTIGERLRCTLCSGGVEPELFAEVKSEFEGRNRRSMFILAMLGICEGVILIVSDFVNGDFAPALPLYIALLVASIGIAAFSRSSLVSNPNHLLVSCFMGLSVAMLYGLGIAFQHPSPDDYPAITFIVLFVALPLMFTDVAWRMILFQLFWACVFMVLSWQLSSPWVLSYNLLNIVTFTAVGAVLYCTISNEHVRQVVDHLKLESETERFNAVQSAILMRLSNVIEGRDEDTGGHVTRSCSFVADLLYDLREEESWRLRLPDSFVNQAVLCASLHDMGKLQIPDAILNKPGRLTDEEFEVMKLHTVYGEELIKRTLEGLVGPDDVVVACNIVRSHHERWDGTGYPDGLAGEDIPVEARAMALADVFDALTHERCYKKAFTVAEAIEIIEEGRGTQFDPEMTDAFVARRREEGCAVNEKRVRQLRYLQFGELLK